MAEAFGVLKLMHDDFRTGVTCAGNFGRDADTIGAICGAILGAKYGYHTIPPVWAEKSPLPHRHLPSVYQGVWISARSPTG